MKLATWLPGKLAGLTLTTLFGPEEMRMSRGPAWAPDSKTYVLIPDPPPPPRG